jgi:hypothetical protein
MRDANVGHLRDALDTLGRAYKAINKVMIGVDFAFGSAALVMPARVLPLFGQEAPSPDAAQLFRNSGTIWLTFGAAHLTAAIRGRDEDWWALAWLRAAEALTNAVWAYSPAITRRGARSKLLATSVSNLVAALAFAAMAHSHDKRALEQ